MGNLIKKQILPHENKANNILPNTAIHSLQQNSYKGGKGYLTYPNSGEYFIWYPKADDDVMFLIKIFNIFFIKN